MLQIAKDKLCAVAKADTVCAFNQLTSVSNGVGMMGAGEELMDEREDGLTTLITLRLHSLSVSMLWVSLLC